MSLSIYYTYHSLTQVWRISDKGNTLGLEKNKTTDVGSASYYFGADSISEEVAGFSPLWFPREKFFVSCLLCCAYVLLLCILFSQLKILRS